MDERSTTTTAAGALSGAQQAAADAAEAARAAGVAVRTVSAVEECRSLAMLFAQVWGRAIADVPVPAEVLRAVAHAGGYVAAAYDGAQMVGGSMGFLGRHAASVHLHSHITGVLPGAAGRRVGLALKLHQRAWAAEAGIAAVEWTFDPLVRRNGYFNLTKLGARMVGYAVDFYGPMADGLNAGDETDRAVVVWPVSGVRPAAGRAAERAGTVVLAPDQAGRPVATRAVAARRLAWVPEDIVALRRSDPAVARAWRLALRAVLQQALDDGLTATALTRDGWYVLEAEAAA